MENWHRSSPGGVTAQDRRPAPCRRQVEDAATTRFRTFPPLASNPARLIMPPAALASFPPPPGQYSPREVGGGRATRQPGQVRKEAALTSAVRVARQPPTLLTPTRSPHERSDMRGCSAGFGTRPGFRYAHPGYEPIFLAMNDA